MENYSDILMTLALGGLAVSLTLFAVAWLYPCLCRAWDKASHLARAAFCGAAAVACLYGGAKHKTGGITYPKTDTDVAYLVDAGSYVTNDAVHVAFTRVPTVPDTATFYLDYCALDGTNAQGVATNWVNAKTATFADLSVPFDFAFAAATNYNWMAYTDWTPGPAVQTNGVWHAYWGVDKKQGRYFIPVRTCVRDGGEVIATPKSKWDAVDPLTLTEQEAYLRYAPDTAFVIDLSKISTTSFKIVGVGAATHSPKRGEAYTIDWGDGTTSSGVSSYGTEFTHEYAAAGQYVVRISDMAAAPWVQIDGSAQPAVVRALRWGDDTDFGYYYYGANLCRSFMNCKNLREFPDGKLPRWPANCASIGGVYYNCTSLAATSFPDWPANCTSIGGVYYNCTSLAATSFPEWPAALTYIEGDVYSGCTAVKTDTIPKWPLGLTRIGNNGVYQNCKGLTATEIPDWPTNCCKSTGKLGYTYWNTGIKPTRLPDWPTGENVKIIDNVYRGCDLSGVTSLPDWPTSLQQANSTYCGANLGTLAKLPDWPTSLQQANYTYYGANLGALAKLPDWPTSLQQANYTYSENRALSVPSLPDWPTTLTSATRTFAFCTSLSVPSLPAWTNCTALTSCSWTFRDCYNIAAEVPALPPNVQNAEQTFYNCQKLTGEIKPWPSSVVNANYTYGQCFALTGNIPAWGEKTTSAANTYVNCRALTGAWTDDPAELMPTNITSHGNCVSGASDALRGYFYQSWGGSLPDPAN